VITLQAHGRRVQWLPQLGSVTKQGAKHYRTGLRHGFAGFSTIAISDDPWLTFLVKTAAPTLKYIEDYERGYREGSNVADKAGLGASYVPPEIKYAEELIARHKFAVQQGDDVHTKNVEGDIMDYGDNLTRQAGGIAQFVAVLKADHSAFRREMKRQQNPTAKAITLLLDYAHAHCAQDCCSFRDLKAQKV
jgi:hypothetical protein